MKQVWFVFTIVTLLLMTSCGGLSNDRNDTTGSNPMNIADSIEMFTDRISNDSSNFELFRDRAELFLRNGQLNPAFRDINAAIELEQNDPETYVVLSDIYFMIGQVENAISALKKAVELNPENTQNVVKLARTYILLRDFNTAQKHLDYVLSLDVDYAEVYYLRAIGKLDQGDTAAALTDMKIAGNLDTTFYITYMHIGNLLSILDDPEAIDYYQLALNARPNDEKAMFFIARLYQEYGAFDQSLEMYEELIKAHPGNQNVFYNMGYINLVELENVDAAIDAFQTAITIDPGYADAVYNLGRAYEEKGMYVEARLNYRQVLEIRTNYPLAIDALNRLDEIQYGN